MKRRIGVAPALCLLAISLIPAATVELQNTCRTTTDDPCFRSGTCTIQGADWSQVVTVIRAGIFDTQGWPGLCDMVHVALVQGDCEPPGAKVNVTAYLTDGSFADIPEIVGPLECAGSAQGAGAVPDGATRPGPALAVEDAGGGQIRLSWSPSCASTDVDYEIYEGSIGSYGSHLPAACSTAGATSFVFTPSAGDSYYLVVPRNTSSEGSYGIDGSGLERPPSSGACLAQVLLATCP